MPGFALGTAGSIMPVMQASSQIGEGAIASTASAPPAVGNEMFLHNMAALWRADPELAIKVDAVDDEERLPLAPTRSGAFSARVSAADGSSVYLHSRYDPQREACKLADAVKIEEKFCFVVSGFGLGYHLRALCDRLRGDAFILCLEPSVELIAAALTCVDLAEVFSSGRLLVLFNDDKARMHDLLKAKNTLMMLGLQFVRHEPSVRVAPDFHVRMSDLITEFATYTRMSLLTLVANSKITCKNIAMNLAAYVTTPPIDILRDRFKGDPAIIVSAGPSLYRNIDQLPDARGRAVLLAVQSTLVLMLERGIKPDFVTSLDFHEVSGKFFEGIGDVSGVHLVAEPKVTWGVIDRYPGPTSLLDNRWARLLIGDELAARGGVKAGATVAHLAFYLAQYMGCDPIIFVGQDLAFTGHVFYVPGVETHLSWRGEINRFNTMEMKEWERIVRNGDILRKVKGIDGGELYTDELLFTYLEQFEKDIAGTRTKVINATEGGAVIRGTQAMTLREAMDRYCAEPIAVERFAYRDTVVWRDPSCLPAARDELKKRLEELDEVADVCDELLSLLHELETLTGDPDRFNRRLVRVDELRTKVQRASRPYEMVNLATQAAELRRYSADRRLSADEPQDSIERAKRQLVRDIDFISGVADGTKEVRPMIEESLARVEAAMNVLPSPKRKRGFC